MAMVGYARVSSSGHTVKYPPEFHERGVRLYTEQRPDYRSDNAAYKALSEKLGCSADTT